MKLYNSYSQTIEELKPIEPGKISMYVCGPTVYNYPHIGNARPIVVFDTLKKALSAQGYEVTFASNYTDVDDKIIKTAIEQNVTEKEITDKFIVAYNDVRKGLHADLPDYAPRVTETMDRIIEFIDKMVKNGSAYQVGGDVYFRVNSDKKYGELSHQSIDDLMVGARIDENEKKENPLDFTLWKETTEGIKWDSPWSKGRPGWHTECVVMIQDVFKKTLIDIHGGGLDLKFPHHENEIAQSETLNEKTFANYWMHNGMIQVDGTKMSKSLGNFFTLHDIKKEYDLMVIRFWLLTTNYRQPINFTREIIEGASKSLDRINNAVFRLEDLLAGASGDEIADGEKVLLDELYDFENKFIQVMDNDLNTADGITVIFDLVKFANTKVSGDNTKALIKTVLDKFLELEEVLGIKNIKKSHEGIDEDKILALIEERTAAKKNKDYQRADAIRDELDQMGVAIKDTREGVKWELK